MKDILAINNKNNKSEKNEYLHKLINKLTQFVTVRSKTCTSKFHAEQIFGFQLLEHINTCGLCSHSCG